VETDWSSFRTVPQSDYPHVLELWLQGVVIEFERMFEQVHDEPHLCMLGCAISCISRVLGSSTFRCYSIPTCLFKLVSLS
jgi:hypothetical protein